MVHGVIMTRDEIIHELDQLVKEAGYLYSLAIMAHRDISVDVNEILGINWYERISFREFSFLVGLLTKQVLTRDMPSTEVINRHIERTYKLLQQLHECHIDPLKDLLPEALENSECKPEKEKVRDFKKLFGSGQWMTEPMFYGAAQSGPVWLDSMVHSLSGASRSSDYTAVSRVVRLSQYTCSGVLPSSALCGLCWL